MCLVLDHRITRGSGPGPRSERPKPRTPTGKYPSTLPCNTSQGAQQPQHILHLGPGYGASRKADTPPQIAECGPLAGNQRGPLERHNAHDILHIGLGSGTSVPHRVANCGSLAANPSGPLDMAVTSTYKHRGAYTYMYNQ